MKNALNAAALLALMACMGCESNAPSDSLRSEAAPPPPTPAAPNENAPPAEAAPAAGTAPQTAAADATEDGTLKKAEAGVGRKGRDYGGPGFITTPIMAKYTIEQRIAFEAQIPNAMKIYKAAHDNKGPKTHQEFWDVIIKENAVPLPDLPAGESYLYDPETEELMVKSPKPE